MQIGEVIRKYRKSGDMTQEEMARRLGVTAPAVNKWEHGNSFPDITLLAPIARLLGITVDTLLAFHDELTDEEMKCLIVELGRQLREEPYEEAFQWAKGKMELYPNCETLIWQLAVVLDAKRVTEEIPNSEFYGRYLETCYTRLLESQDENMRKNAADSLFQLYLRKGEYERAEQYLSYFSDQNPEKKRKQAIIYSKTDRIDEAYQAYEEMLYAGYQSMNLLFHNVYLLAMQGDDRKKAHYMVKKQRELAAVFDMGEYNEAASGFELAQEEQDVEMTLELMEKMIAGIEHPYDYCKSPLYEHMEFKAGGQKFLGQMKKDMLECFGDEEMFPYLKGNKRWMELALKG